MPIYKVKISKIKKLTEKISEVTFTNGLTSICNNKEIDICCNGILFVRGTIIDYDLKQTWFPDFFGENDYKNSKVKPRVFMDKFKSDNLFIPMKFLSSNIVTEEKVKQIKKSKINANVSEVFEEIICKHMTRSEKISKKIDAIIPRTLSKYAKIEISNSLYEDLIYEIALKARERYNQLTKNL